MAPSPREAASHAIKTWEGLYQDSPVDVGNLIRLADGSIHPPGGTSAARVAAARKPGSVVIGTMRGITPAVWAKYRNIPITVDRHGRVTGADPALTPDAVKAIRHEDAVDIYDKMYYRGPGFDKLPWHPATEVWVDIGWGSGPITAIKKLQLMIGVAQDGQLGPVTVQKYTEWLNQNPELEDDVEKIADWRCAFYRSIVARDAAQGKWLGGWLNRANYYRPRNPKWWGLWKNGIVPPVERSEGIGRPVPEEVGEGIKAEVEASKIVQYGTIAGTIATTAASTGIFGIIPPWAIGIAVVAIVAVGALFALRSLGIIKKNA